MVEAKILLVEDDEGLRELLRQELEDEGYEIEEAASAEESKLLFETFRPDLIVSDLRLPGSDGLSFLREVRKRENPPGFVMITAFGTVSRAVEALKEGADEFLTKPLDLEHLRLAVSRVLEVQDLRRSLQRYRDLDRKERFHGMIGNSREMLWLFEQIRRIARADGPVLLTGESGVGKELAARAIHQESSRRHKPFIPVNCAGMPADLMESEFFGHVKGAFSGAVEDRIGLFREAEGGVLFLDEITEMPLELQAKLLRTLEDGKVRPVGGVRHHDVDVRVFAAGNRDVEEAVREGLLRQDLFYRLETFMLPIPALRDRGEDLELLIAHFLNDFSLQLNKDIRGVSPEAMNQLLQYPFPGNVRELRNAIERGVAFCDGSQLELSHLPKRIRRSPVGASPHVRQAFLLTPDLLKPDNLPSLEDIRQRYSRYVLDRVAGNKRRAASILGIGRRTLYRYIEEYEDADRK